MHITVELPSGVYLAEIFSEGEDGGDHRFTVLYRHNDLKLADAAEAVLKVIREEYSPDTREDVKTVRIVLVRDSLWSTLHDYLRQMTEREGLMIRTVNFTHSPLYRVRDQAELAITFMNLANLPAEVEAGLDGLMGDAREGALVPILLTLEMARHYAEREESIPRFPRDLCRVDDHMPAELASVMASRLESNLIRDRLIGTGSE